MFGRKDGEPRDTTPGAEAEKREREKATEAALTITLLFAVIVFGLLRFFEVLKNMRWY